VRTQLEKDANILTMGEQFGSGTAHFGGQAKQGAEGASLHFYPLQCIDLLRCLDYYGCILCLRTSQETLSKDWQTSQMT
jgi:hypothetical protein